MEAQGVFTLITFVVLELVTLRHHVLNAKIVNFITCVNEGRLLHLDYMTLEKTSDLWWSDMNLSLLAANRHLSNYE